MPSCSSPLQLRGCTISCSSLACAITIRAAVWKVSKMLPRRLASSRLSSSRGAASRLRTPLLVQSRYASDATQNPDITDPGMNGGYVNPPARKRALRDPHGDWWDKQERRNFGEPVHEDNDVLGVFSTEPYTHAPPGRAFFHLTIFVAAVFGLAFAVKQTYPDRISAPRVYVDGLDKELGGPTTVLARKPGDNDPEN